MSDVMQPRCAHVGLESSAWRRSCIRLESLRTRLSSRRRTSRDVQHVRPGMDAELYSSRYLDQVERANVSTRLAALVQPLRRIDPWLIDLVLGTVFVTVGLIALFAPDAKHTYREPDAMAVFLTVLAAAPYYVRRRAPLLVLMVTTVPVVILAVAGYPTGASPNWLLVGTYTVAAHTEPVERLLGAASVSIGLGVVAIAGAPDLTGASIA